MTRRRPLAAVVAAVALLVGTVGCGIPNDQEAHNVEIGNFVEDVERLSLAAQASGETADGARISVYMINTEELLLVPVARTAPYYSLEQIMKQLFFGPTGAETSEGIRSSISSRTRVREVDISNGEAKIDVSSPLTDSGGFEIVLALAQIVMTASQVRGVESVRLFLDGTQVLDAPRQDGTSTSEPLTPSDYEQLVTK